MRGAAAIQFGSKYASVGIQLVFTAALARALTPQDFGLVAVTMAFSAFFGLFSDLGIGVAIVQFRDLDERDLGALVFFSGMLGIGLAALFCALGPAVAAWYGDGRLAALCWASSPALVLSSLNMVPGGVMLRERRFGQIGLRLVVSTLASGTLAVVLAVLGLGCYALVAQTVASRALVLAWNVASHPIRTVNRHFVAPLRRVFSYSAYQLGFGLVNYFSRNLDNLLVGRFLGMGSLGYYDKAYKLTVYPLSALSAVAASVVQPFMAEHQHDPDRIFACWMRVEKSLSLLGVPVACLFVCAAPEVISVLYGPGWQDAVAPFAVLSASVYFQMMCNPSGAFFQSLGRTDSMFRVGVINTALTLAGLAAGLLGGSVTTVATGVCAAYCMHVGSIAYYLVIRGFGRGLSCLAAFLPEVVVGVVAVAACELACDVARGFVPAVPIASLACKALLIGAAVLAGYALTGQLRVARRLMGRR